MLKGMMDWGSGGGRRGRPPKPTTNRVGEYLRRQREERGWTIRQLAKEIGMPESSAGYLSQLETGSKTPSPEVAERLEERLGDRRGIFRLWSLTGRRTEPHRAMQARRELSLLLGDPTLMGHPLFTPEFMSGLEAPRVLHHQREDWQELPPTGTVEEPEEETAAEMEESIGTSSAASEPGTVWQAPAAPVNRDRQAPERVETRYAWMQRASARAVRAPVLREGTLPEDYREPDLRQCESVRLEPDALPGATLARPFAYRLSAEGARRVRHVLHEGDLVVMTREAMPIVRQEIYGVRLGSQVVLSYVAWNGRELLLLPAPEDNDFQVLRADSGLLPQLVVARVVTAVRDLGSRRGHGRDV